jgi:hypothetical protein
MRFIDDRGGAEWMERYLGSYYLKWMGVGARRDQARLLIPVIRARAAELSVAEISQMVMMQWRVQVMGAWYAIARADPVLSGPLHRAFEFCYGTLTAPCLATAVLTYPGTMSGQVLSSYYERDLEHRYGASAIISAALRRLAPDPAQPDRTPEDGVLDELLHTARLLQTTS